MQTQTSAVDVFRSSAHFYSAGTYEILSLGRCL